MQFNTLCLAILKSYGHNLEDSSYQKGLAEALLFVSSEPLKLNHIAKVLDIEKSEARDIIEELILDYSEKEGGFILKEIAGAYQFITNPIYHDKLSDIFKEKKRDTLSKGVLETLAILAYKQPATLSEIDEIRGVSSRGMITSLITKKLVKAVGQKEIPGRPTLYGTTNDFLVHFGLGRLSDLPAPVEVKELKFDDIDDIEITQEDENGES